MHPHARGLALLVLVPALCSCSEEQGFRKPTYPVIGQVYVDGSPASNVEVTLHDVKGFDTEHPSVSMTYTDAEGKFAVSTYEQADGVPEGEYVVTFYWGEMNMFSMEYSGPDKLNDRYRDPQTAPNRVKVEPGKEGPTDMGKVELTTK